MNTAASTAAANVHHDPAAARNDAATAMPAITRSTTPFVTRRATSDIDANRSTSARLCSCVTERHATIAESPRTRPNGATMSAPTAGLPLAIAANATTTSVPADRYVRNPMPRPAPYNTAANGRPKYVRHQSGTWRRSCGTGTCRRVSVPSAYTAATAPSASNPARPHGAPSEPPIHPRTAPNNAAVPVAPSACNASVPSQRPRPPWTTGEMVSTIDSPQGPWSADHPAIADAATSAAINAPSSTTLPVPGR